MNDYPAGRVSPEQAAADQAAAEQALTADLDQLVAVRELTEAEAAAVLPGYEYPELALWIRPDTQESDPHPPPVAAVRDRGLRLQQQAAWNQYAQERDRITAARAAGQAEAGRDDGDDYGS